jgi:D-threo-aldose 1-dehydrogenase
VTTKPLGGTGLAVTAVCVGTSPLASMPGLYGYEVTEDRAVATIDAVLDSDLLHLHDPERISFAEATAPGGAVEALADLKREGLVAHLGVAGGPVALMQQYLDTGVFEVVLTHNRYTLLDRSAEALFRAAHDRGIGVLNAAPYGGGMLAKGPGEQTKYAYGQGNAAVADAATAMWSVADRAGVPLAAAAVQFSSRASFIDSTVVGVSSPDRVQQTLDLAGVPIPAELWAELETLVPASELWLDPPSH